MSGIGTGTGTGTASPSSQRKWYEDDVVVTDKDEERQTQFSRAGIGFDAIQVKLQELYEVGVLKLFIETEILKSNTGAFEPGFKDLYSPFSMTIPQRIGKDLLFTSDVEFSESGFVPGSLENDKKKIFLNQTEFTKYLLRLPKPISDTATPLDEKKQDMNAYKYLQILGTEIQDKILFLCDGFIQGFNQQFTKNKNDILRLQNEINDLKRLTGQGITRDDIQKRAVEKEKQLVEAKNVKTKLETKRANYKNACAILSNATSRSQYNASLVAAYPALKNDASSYSTVMVDWFKYKQYSSNFFKDVCKMFTPMIPKEMLSIKQEILIAIQDVAKGVADTFKPIFESYFFNELGTNIARYTPLIPNNTYASYLFELTNPITRRTDPSKFSWLNIAAMFAKIIKDTPFTNKYDKIEFERLQVIVKLLANFNSEILTIFSLFKFEKNLNIYNKNDNKNAFERAEQDDDYFKHVDNVNALFQNVYYLKHIFDAIRGEIAAFLIVGGGGGLLPAQVALINDFQSKIAQTLGKMVDILLPKLDGYRVKTQRYDYDTLLGTASHSRFVENAFTGKIAFISHFYKNNKFLVSSEFIQNSPVTITIPDGNYTLETLESTVENALCSTCKWARKSNYDAEMLWRCKYDSKKFLQLRLYFPMTNMRTLGPRPNFPNIYSSLYQFRIRSANINAPITLSIPTGEYKNITDVLVAMQKTINDFITVPNINLIREFKSTFTITLEFNAAINAAAPCIKFELKNNPPSTTRFDDLSIMLLAPQLSELFCQSNVNILVDLLSSNVSNPIWLPQTNPNRNSEKMLVLPPRELTLSTTITIDTSTKIDGEVYDASDIFGITRPNAAAGVQGSLQLFPDITINQLQVSDNYDFTRECNNRVNNGINNVNFQSCIFITTILDEQFNLVAPQLLAEVEDFGILNFTSKRINDELIFKAVSVKEIEKKSSGSTAAVAAGSDRNVFKNEILAKTGVYMNQRLMNVDAAKVPVISPVDILNSILYRYPCIPPPVKRELVEGSVGFDEFIEERVNVASFNAIVCLGKGEKGQTPSTTFKRVLEKTLMYDEGDGRRNKLFCDLHYAICGPVYMDENPSGEINQLTILDKFTLQNNRPDVVTAGAALPYLPKPPFKVKGITPFYDYEKEYYKYLIYGECQESTYTFGCIKYYDPGEKIGPGYNVNASELYDVIHVYSYQIDPATNLYTNVLISSTIDHVYSYDQRHNEDSFIIVGDFQHIMFKNKYDESPATNPHIEYITLRNLNFGSFIVWRFPHIVPAPVPVGTPDVYFGFDNQFIDPTYLGFRVSNILQLDTQDVSRIRLIIFANNDQGQTYIYLPFATVPGNWTFRYLSDRDTRTGNNILYKVSSSAISVNKTLKSIKKQRAFYIIMRNKYAGNPTLRAYANTKQTESMNELVNLTGSNPSIENNLLWLGLREKTQLRKILSCTIIDVTTGTFQGLDLPIDFEDDDTIENIRVDMNNPEIVTVFGRFKATISDVPGANQRPKKIIRNVMVIYTNLRNATQNDANYGLAATYSLTYDNFKEVTVNGVPEFQSFYSCLDGLVAASIDKGTMQQNIGILTVKKTQSSQISVIGFHNTKMTAVSDKSTVKDGTNPSPLLCYDYNMCADNLKIVYNAASASPVPPATDVEQGIFNPVTFYAFYDEIENTGTGAKTFTSRLSKGVYALIHAKNPIQLFSAPSHIHVLNTWGIDLSSNQTLFYKRLYESSRTRPTLNFNIKGYEKYMNDIVDTILSSAKAYYEEKIKSTFYEYGTIDGSPPILFKRDGKQNKAIVGGGKAEDAKQMLLATEYALDADLSKNEMKNRKSVTFKKKIEIRIPDIMMSDEYLSAITEPERKNARMIFVNSIFKHSIQLHDIITKENRDVAANRGAENNVVILDEYEIVLCSKNETIRNRFNELISSYGNVNTSDFLTLSDDVFGFESTDSSQSQQNNKNIIIVNEWNDKGFIGDYGAYAYSDASALTPNQTMISKSQQIVAEATSAKEAVTRVVPKYPNTSFLLNPVFSFHTLDPSKWVGFRSLFDTSSAARTMSGGARIMSGGVYPAVSRYGSYGPSLLQDPYMYSQIQAANPSGLGGPYGYPGYALGQQPGFRPQGYGYGYGYGYDNGASDQVIRMKNKVLESSDIQSKNLKKITLQVMQTDTRFKKVVLWLFDSRENKMLMTKTFIGKNKVVLSLPVQNQQVGAVRGSGYSLLQQLSRRLFNQVDIIRKWTLEVAYAYDDAASGTTGTTGIFIYSAKSFELPKPTLELIYVNMQAVLNLTKGTITIQKGNSAAGSGTTDENGSKLEINPRDVALIGEVFRVVPLIQGGIISSTSKEFNDIVAGLVSKTPHQHSRSSISEKKRRENVEANINFLINLFFSQNSLFFVRGQLKYYIYSTQRSCKIFTIVKQPGYDDDSYLTCLKLFLQSENDYKQKSNTFRVGCSMKKKMIADNFSSVWDSFWNDLIDSQEQATTTKQLENEIGIEAGEGEGEGDGEGEEGEGEGKGEGKEGKGKDDSVTAPVCLKIARTTCKRMYEVSTEWNLSSYYPLAYNGILYNTDSDPSQQQYGFNNEFYYNIEPADYLQTNGSGDIFSGFKCMKYNGDSANPVLYLGGKYTNAAVRSGSGVFQFNLKEKKIKPILIATDDNSEILCIDMIGKILLIGGIFQNVSIFKDGEISVDRNATTVPLVIMNIETYEITPVYDDDAAIPSPRINSPGGVIPKISSVCICKKRRIVNEKNTNVYEYVGLFGGNIMIETAGAGLPHNIENIGCLVVKVPVEESNPNVTLVARMYCIDTYVEEAAGPVVNSIVGVKLENLPLDQTNDVSSIICDEEADEANEDAAKNKTTFYVGGYFNAFTFMDYKGFQEAEAAAAAAAAAAAPGSPPAVPTNPNAFIKQGQCNSILKLTITSTYDSVANDYRQRCAFEPIETNANKNNVVFNASLALNRADSKGYLIAFTAFFDKAVNPAPASMNNTVVNTSLNVFDLNTKVNTQTMVAVPTSRGLMALSQIIKQNYRCQCITVVEDVQSKKRVAVFSYSIVNSTTAMDHFAYSFTCVLNMEARLKVVESKSNDETETSQYNSITEMCSIENENGNQTDVYLARENVIKNANPVEQILYPLTVKSNYQQIGNWNMATVTAAVATTQAVSIQAEVEIFFQFVKSIMELRKIFKEYPSMTLFLQNIDYRDKNEKITTSVLQKMYIDLENKTSLNKTSIREPKIIGIEDTCNNIFLKVTVLLDFWYAAINANIHYIVNTNEALFDAIKGFFYDNFIFLLIYAGCFGLAQTLCENYVSLVLSSVNTLGGDTSELTKDNWKEKFMKTFESNETLGMFKTFFNEMAPQYDRTYTNIMICSNPETYTGIAYVERRLDAKLRMLVSDETKQKALQNKIYKSNEAFFSDDTFSSTLLASDDINTVDQINFCSFYKFRRFQMDGATPFRTNFGGMLDETVYVSVNVVSKVKIEAAKLFEFLKVIIIYFKKLGAAQVDTGIGGPIKRIIFGGDFGCNLLHDAEVCSKFEKNGMKIYTMPNNSNAFVGTNSSGNQMFIVDANAMSSSSSSLVVGGGGREQDKNHVKRLIIGEPIQVDKGKDQYQSGQQGQNIKLIIMNHKNKTKRRYK
jgi:hypothetical protein